MLRIETKETKHIIEYKGAKFTVVPNTKEETAAILKQNAFVHKIETPLGRKDEYEERIDWVGVNCDEIDSQVRAWEGIADNLECNSENKRALAGKKENEHICLFIKQEIAKIGAVTEEKKKAKAKN